MMNQNETTQILKIVLTATVLVMLTSCGNTKSAEPESISNNFSSTSTKVLASCNKVVTSDMSLNAAAVVDQMGQPDLLIKAKLNFLSSASTAPGNVIKFFRMSWTVNNGAQYLDPNPILIQEASTTSNQIVASTVTSTKNYFLYINDAQQNYQAVKAVVYSSSGSIVSQTHFLIPQFFAKANDYQYFANGTTRPASLQSLHPLATTNTAGWSEAQYTNHYQAFCF